MQRFLCLQKISPRQLVSVFTTETFMFVIAEALSSLCKMSRPTENLPTAAENPKVQRSGM